MEIRTIDILGAGMIAIPERFRGSNDEKTKQLSSLVPTTGNFFYLPVVIETDGKMTVVARHWVFAHYVSRQTYKFPVLIIDDESLLPIIIENDERDIQKLLAAETGRKDSKRNTTKDRERNRTAGRICPFCAGILRRPRSKNDRLRDGGHVITCENHVKDKNSKYSGKRCDFEMILTDTEIDFFAIYELDISKRLELTEELCPQCQNHLYKRTIIKKDSISTQLRCRNGYSSLNKCSYGRRI